MKRQDVNEFVSKALDSADLRRALNQVAEEKAIRPVRRCRTVVLNLPKKAGPDSFAHLAPGTVTAFIARQGEPLLSQLAEAIRANDSNEFKSAIDKIKRMAEGLSRKITTPATYPKTRTRAFPSFADIAYASKSLVSYVHWDDVLRVHVHAFPYNGGSLDKKEFSLVEYYRPDADTPLECIFLVRPPTLSEIEREALRLVPSNASANNVASAVIAPVTPALIAFVAVAAEAAAKWLYNEFVNWYVCILYGKTVLASIPDSALHSKEIKDKLSSLPPEVTAAELLRLRTDLLLKTLPD